MSIITLLFFVFSGAALLATAVLALRQSLILAYILLGLLLGPAVTGLLGTADQIASLANIGIIFLLFLLGLNLNPKELLVLAGEASIVTGFSSLLLLILGAGYSYLLGFDWIESLVIGSCLMFSSTIIGLKLIPTTVLHHQRTGEVIITILLIQDILAILLLLLIDGLAPGQFSWTHLGVSLASFPLLVGFAYVLEKFVLARLIRYFDRIQEYIFLLAIGWCLGLAELAELAGLSYEIGAFVAGVAIARSPIALFIAESLKPLRDFFLILFFVTLGANFPVQQLADVWIAAVGLSLFAIVIKPLLFRYLLRFSKESSGRATEVAVRLGQMSEFSLLLAVLATAQGLIGERASSVIQAATVASFVFSSWYVVRTYPTPIGLSDKLRRD